MNQTLFTRAAIFGTLAGSLALSAVMVLIFALTAPWLLGHDKFSLLFFASSTIGGLIGFLYAEKRYWKQYHYQH